jgi:UDP-N-acetylmuramoyl-L-alanyl-D-glutamate--2,6-diaminopimelate ligase
MFMTARNRRSTMTVSLRRLLPDASFVGCADVVVSDITEHSGECASGAVFAAVPGTHRRGADYIPEALARGASAVMTSQPLAAIRVPQCVVADVRKAYAEVCHALSGYPSWRLGLAGVTGTNGKTTTTWLVRSILETAGRPCGILGTVEYSDGMERAAARLTTPDAKSFSRWLESMVSCRTRYAAVELSSHALDQHRAAGTLLDAAVVTNVTQDHFDYHGTAERYLAAKARILGMLKRSGLAVLNAEDPLTVALAEQIPATAQVCTFGIDSAADVFADRVRLSRQGSRFRLRHRAGEVDVYLPLVGRHNVANSLAAASVAMHFGLSLSDIAAGLEAVGAVPGRLEAVNCGQDFGVFVDYAHTDDALHRAIAAVREITTGRVYCVFGAGGDRDRSKRPLMGRAAAAADVPVVTSDNPRSEDPRAIIDDILPGFDDSSVLPHVEPNRASAIAWALEQAAPGDSVLIAGKGHERVQIVGSEHIPFDDASVCRKALACRAPAAAPWADEVPV